MDDIQGQLERRKVRKRAAAALPLAYTVFRETIDSGLPMTVTVNLPPDIEAGLLAEARARGLSIDTLLATVIRRFVADTVTMADVQPSLRNEQGAWVLYGGEPMPADLVDETLEAVRHERDLMNLGPRS